MGFMLFCGMRRKSEKLWINLWKRLGLKGDWQPAYADLVCRYSESHRFYHDLTHIEHCFLELSKMRNLAADLNAVELALWYHDAIYDVRRNDNEEKSADLAKEFCLRIGLSDAFAKKVRALILSSKHHRGNPGDLDEQIFTDLDLSAWGKSWKEFQKDTKNIRLEYSWVTEAVFRKKRAEILKGFLDRPSIYNTDYFRARYEIQARKNLKRSLTRLVKNKNRSD